jgi:hypothetical protein
LFPAYLPWRTQYCVHTCCYNYICSIFPCQHALHSRIMLSSTCPFQGLIQNFKLGGAHLKKLRRAEGGAKILGVFRVKNHDFMPNNHIFSNCGGRRENFGVFRVKNHDYTPKNHIPPWIRPCFLRLDLRIVVFPLNSALQCSNIFVVSFSFLRYECILLSASCICYCPLRDLNWNKKYWLLVLILYILGIYLKDTYRSYLLSIYTVRARVAQWVR